LILILLSLFTPTTPLASKGIPLLLATDRGVTFSLAIFLILMLSFVSRYPVSLGRNVVVLTVLYAAFFLSNTLSGLLKSVFGLSLYAVVDTALMGVASACAFAFFILLSPQGEEVQVNLPAYGPDSEKRLLMNLDALNRTLLRASRK
jgi:hypothetical protein